jgi:hypothetical protein
MSEEKNLLEEAIGLLRMVYMAVSGCDETEPHRAYDQLRLDVLPSIVEWEERARSVFFKEESEAPQSTRPTPELPEGYRVELEHNDLFLCCGNDVIARLHQDDGRLKLVGTLLGGSLHQTHFDALAAFLQGAR